MGVVLKKFWQQFLALRHSLSSNITVRCYNALVDDRVTQLVLLKVWLLNDTIALILFHTDSLFFSAFELFYPKVVINQSEQKLEKASLF